ncbi:MAG: MFS transporter [Bacteroidales bacterium]|nr:MFS transporter [Bacteroidales bacterium]
MNIRLRLSVLNFLLFAVWGAYLTSMGSYLHRAGLGEYIGWFYSAQGFVSLFMPALMGVIADRHIAAQRLLSICQFLSAIFMCVTGWIGMTQGQDIRFEQIFPFYVLGTAFFMPSLALGCSVSYNALGIARLDPVKVFPSIRIFGTLGFICSMWMVDLLGCQHDPRQFFVSAAWGGALTVFALTLPPCPVSGNKSGKTLASVLGIDSFSLFRDKQLRTFFIFSILIGINLQITNGYANTFISTAFNGIEAYADSFVSDHTNILISLSQISEMFCILLIPFFLRRYGIKWVIITALIAWVLRFSLFALGNPGSGLWMFVLSMIVYGVAFDFFNISGTLFIEKNTDECVRSSAQGIFVMMTNGFGATIGMLGAQWVVNRLVYSSDEVFARLVGWTSAWYVFAAYALTVTILFALLFNYNHQKES